MSATASQPRSLRWLLGVAALVVVAPLPFGEPQPAGVAGWPMMAVHAAGCLWFLTLTARGSSWRLPNWAMNLIGLAYIPIFFFQVRLWVGSNLVRPMVELLMVGLLAKLLSLRGDRDKWHVMVLIFFLFVAAMATSIHPAIFLYLVLVVGLGLALLYQFVAGHLRDTVAVAPLSQRPPLARMVTVGTLIVVVAAVPFFALMPRLRSPYLLGRDLASRGGTGVGYSDSVSLDVVGNVRSNTEVAFRVQMEERQNPPPMRFRGTTYERFEKLSWLRMPERFDVLRPSAATFYRLSDKPPAEKLQVWLEPLGSRSLVLPEGTVSIEVPGRIVRDHSGGVSFLQKPSTMVRYRVGLDSRAARSRVADSFELATSGPGTLDDGGVTPRIAQLADDLVGSLAPAGKASRLEQHLATAYDYTLDLVGSGGENPIETFLFESREGHCEYFATAMVLMLRSQGVPARFVTGFLGAELNPLEDYWVVRQNNAHAWVEAWLPEQGWTTFDPTPESGRPGSSPPSIGLMLRQAWDYLEFRWDRYVMAFGSIDQLGMVMRVREVWRDFKSGLESVDNPFEADDSKRGWQDFEIGRLRLPPASLWLIAAGLSMLLAASWLARRRFSAAVAYLRMRSAAGSLLPEIGESTAPLVLLETLERRVPEVAQSAGRVVDLYVRESWGGESLAEGDRVAIRNALREVRRGLRRNRSAVGDRAA